VPIRAVWNTCDDGDQAVAIDAGGDLLRGGGAGEARASFAGEEQPHQSADLNGDTMTCLMGLAETALWTCGYGAMI